MSKHLFGIICTHHGTAANNRGETEGNVTTLQKLLWHGEVHTTVSAEAIRWAIRYFWQLKGLSVNRRWNDATNQHEWQVSGFDPERFIDDDVLGFMRAEAAQQEANEAEQATPTDRRRRQRGQTIARRSRLEVTRAVSLTPWRGDVTFNAAGINATPSAAQQGPYPVPYYTEMHATRYQYGFALTPAALAEPARALHVVDALIHLGEVAGNHARFLYDFSPETIVFRWTDDFAPRMLYAFTVSDNGHVRAPLLLERVQAGDILATELVIGGALAKTEDGQALAAAGAIVLPSVREAGEKIKQIIKQWIMKELNKMNDVAAEASTP
jgi:CRISPR-associated protein Cst2|uniref:DevR family CRISPR-associated autoregulator n=1 Tax=Thermomicrobium roseum TaxID=500 RepID=A0A7C1JMJ5_THERO